MSEPVYPVGVKPTLAITNTQKLLKAARSYSVCVYPGGDVHQPCGSEGEDPRGVETLAGG